MPDFWDLRVQHPCFMAFTLVYLHFSWRYLGILLPTRGSVWRALSAVFSRTIALPSKLSFGGSLPTAWSSRAVGFVQDHTHIPVGPLDGTTADCCCCSVGVVDAAHLSKARPSSARRHGLRARRLTWLPAVDYPAAIGWAGYPSNKEPQSTSLCNVRREFRTTQPVSAGPSVLALRRRLFAEAVLGCMGARLRHVTKY
jgi:hypothetical protein